MLLSIARARHKMTNQTGRQVSVVNQTNDQSNSLPAALHRNQPQHPLPLPLPSAQSYKPALALPLIAIHRLARVRCPTHAAPFDLRFTD